MGGHVMTLGEVALLAGVDRATVTHWRSRHAHRVPFPTPARREGGQELFACDRVVDWLQQTGLGRNRRAAEHVVAFMLPGRPLTDARLFHGLSALLCLHVLAGAVDADLDALLDVADEADPDDEFLFAEVRALGDDLAAMAAYAALLVGESYDAVAPLDDLVAHRATPDMTRGSAVSPGLARFAVELAGALADAAEFDDLTVCLLKPRDIALLAQAPEVLEERGGVRVGLPLADADDDPEARLARRWVTAHGFPVVRLESSEGDVPAQSVLLIHYDDVDREADLRHLNELAVRFSPSTRAVVLGAARALTGPLRAPGFRGRPPAEGAPLSVAGRERKDALTVGYTRAIVRLPQGLIDPPAARAALWCLGPEVEPASTYCVDIASGWKGESSVLASDLVAATMSVRARAHRALPGRFVSQPRLTTLDGDLVEAVGGTRHAMTGELLREVDDLLPAVGRDIVGRHDVALTHRAEPAGSVTQVAIGQAVGDGDLIVVPGARIATADLVAGPDIPVVSRPVDVGRRGELTGLTHRDLVRGYSHAEITRPGDIVFDPKARPAVAVDELGGVLVASPARVLRCHVPPQRSEEERERDERAGKHPRPQRFVPGIVAAELEAASLRSRDWRAWQLTVLPSDQLDAAAALAAAVAERRRLLVEELDRLPVLMTVLATALGAEACTISVTPIERKSA